MDKDVMGKSFSHTAINTVGVVLTIVILLGSREVYPAYREAELFDLAYEQYLASQPEKAVEAFSLFLRQFPQSSAKDAAMFWMGKSFILMKQIQEARNIFDEMAREFPGSPLKPYAIREMEELEKGEMAEERESFQGAPYEGEESQMQARQPREEKVTEKSVESAAQPTGSTVYMVQVAALKSENAAVNLRETLKHHGFKAIIQETSSGEGTRFRVLVGEFRTRRGADLHAIKIKKRTGLDAFSIEVRQAEKGNSAPVSHNGPLGANAENEISEQSLILHKKDSAKSKTRESVMRGKDEQVEVLIEGTQYTAEQVSTYMNNSFAAIHTLGIKEIVWRTGHIYEDFINEQLLYEEARRAGFTGGEREHEKTGEHYGLSPEEAVYLQRYLAICRVVGKKLKEHSGERVVESLSVRYTDGDRREKELLASELQGHARKGTPFRDIHALYPERVSYTIMGIDALQGWIKEEIALLENGEISMLWSKEGYMILKPSLYTLSFEAFENMKQGKSDAVRALVREYITELRRERRKIEVMGENKGEP